MGFFNSLSIRISLAIIGGILYSALLYAILFVLDLPPLMAGSIGIVVFLFYLGSRLLILFSGTNSPYYSRDKKAGLKHLYEITPFYQTAQWVGKFYHYHDIVLFIFLAALSIVFVISLIADWANNEPIGNAIQNLWNAFILIL